jgi:O-antigen/teichoic acid export membrane protein
VIGTQPRQRADVRLAEVARGGLLNLTGAGVAGLSTIAVTLIVTRSFSRAAAGAFFAATSLFAIVEAVSTLGAVPGTVYFIARLRSMGQQHRIPEVLRSALRPVAVVSVAAAVALALAASPLARVLVHGHPGQAGASPPRVAAALRALAAALPFAALADTLLGASRGFRAMGPTNAVDRIGRSVAQLAGIAVVAAAGNAALLAPLWALPYPPAACAAWLWLRRVRRRSLAREVPVAAGASGVAGPGRADGAPLRFWRFTAPRGLALLAQVTVQRIDIILVAVMRGLAEAAIYTAATRFLVAGQFVIQAIGMASQPRFTEMFARGDVRGANRIYQATTAWLVLLTWPVYLLAVSFGPQILTVFGHSYRAGAAVMVILGLAMLLLTGCGLVDMVLVTTGRSSWSLVNGVLAVAVNVGLDVLLIPRYGITGAAIGWSAAIAVANLLPLAQVAATVRLQPFGRGTVIAIALSCLSFGVLPLAARELAGHGAVPSLAAIACGCAVMTAGVRRFRADLNLAALPGAARARARPARGRPSVADMAAVLWPPPAAASLARGRPARAGERDYLLLPFPRRPRLLVPSGRRASAAAVRRYGEPGSVTAWAAGRMLALALAGGAGTAGLGGRLRVRVSPGTETIEAYLSAVLGHEVLLSTHLSAARANRKPVLQLLTARGETTAFAKVSVNPLTRDLIRAERAALDTLAAKGLRELTIPRVLHHGQWQGRDVLVLSALPVWRRRRAPRPGQLTAAMAELAAVDGWCRRPLAGSGYLARLRSRLEAAPPGPDRLALGAALDTVAATGAELTFGAWHGDWTGWNMACTADGLLVWDWERFAPGVPLGFDALHHGLQSAVIRRRRPPAAAAAECVRAAPRSLAPFGVPAGEAPLVAVLYLAELSARYLADRQAEAGAVLGTPGTWLIPAIQEAVIRL